MIKIILLAGILCLLMAQTFAPKTKEAATACIIFLIKLFMLSIQIKMDYSLKNKLKTTSIKITWKILKELTLILNFWQVLCRIFWVRTKMATGSVYHNFYLPWFPNKTLQWSCSQTFIESRTFDQCTSWFMLSIFAFLDAYKIILRWKIHE